MSKIVSHPKPLEIVGEWRHSSEFVHQWELYADAVELAKKMKRVIC